MSALVWFRRDLRCEDHAALSQALQSSAKVYCVFVFDTDTLGLLENPRDRRVDFIHQSVLELDQSLNRLSLEAGGTGSGLLVRHGRPQEIIPQLARELGITRVYTNRDYEPDARLRDREVAQTLSQLKIEFLDFKDQVIFERDEVMTQTAQPYRVFTPYSNAWRARLNLDFPQNHEVAAHARHLAPRMAEETIPSLQQLDFEATGLSELGIQAGESGAQALLESFLPHMAQYHEARDIPSTPGTSRLSVHLRFGTISVRQLVQETLHQNGPGASTWLNELIWRDFYQMILWHAPQVVTESFQPQYRTLKWDHRPEWFSAWCQGKTGYPFVDAGMRELLQTGFMHNRLRMVTASFLTKHLGIDWRLGERHFADHLNDYDLASNNGGWQWAASTGCDAQPYFRIFNPEAQSKRFDPEGLYIKKYVPELSHLSSRQIHAPWSKEGLVSEKEYPRPIVDHKLARERTLNRFGKG
jgi:deoxyribodipyrimidine photo-lyase